LEAKREASQEETKPITIKRRMKIFLAFKEFFFFLGKTAFQFASKKTVVAFQVLYKRDRGFY
jgi:hypothetical protein